MGEGVRFIPMILNYRELSFRFGIGEETAFVRQERIIPAGKRFTRRFGNLPVGYDHKYVYSHFGYNLKSYGYAGGYRLCTIGKNFLYLLKNEKKNWNLLKAKISHLS